MKTRVLLWSAVSILVVSLAAGVFWWLFRPRVITFSDDAKITLLAVQYGKRHTPPSSGRGITRGNSFRTDKDTLVIWLRAQYDSKQYHYFQFFLYDKGGTACVQTGPRTWRNSGNQIFPVQFDAFPRRQAKFYVRVQEQGNGGQEMSDQKFVIHNPARRSFATWTAEPLPSTKNDDDVSVTLTKLVAGVDMPYQRDQDDLDDAANKGVQAVFHVERNGQPVSNWQPVSVETTDATGNRMSGWISQNNWQGNDDTVIYQYALWPDEPAWKIRFEFSQQSDFAATELWTVRNIPLQAGRQQDSWNITRNSQTNIAFAEEDLDGIHLKIFPATRFTDMPPNAQPQGAFFIQTTPRLPDGVRMTIAKLTDEQGYDVGSWNGGWSGNRDSGFYQFSLRDVSGVTNLNLTLALHKSRFVEFTVKPERATAQ